MQRLKNILLGLTATLLLGMTAVPAVSYAAAPTPTQSACNAITGNNSCNDTSGSPSLGKIVKVIVNVLSLIVGVAAVIMIMIGGFKYVTSGGDTNATASAKNTLIYAVVGLIVVALAQFIVQFVLHNVT